MSYDPVFLKRKSFEHEKEVRIVQIDILSQQARESMLEEMVTPNKIGRNLPVELEELVDSVFINPLSPDWFADIVEDVTQRYGYRFQVSKSYLLQNPVF